MEKTTNIHENAVIINSRDTIFVKAEEFTVMDSILSYYPKSFNQVNLWDKIKKALEIGVENFYIAKLNPEVNSGYTNKHWKKFALEFCPEMESLIGSDYQIAIFFGSCIKELIFRGIPDEIAWKVVCDYRIANEKNSSTIAKAKEILAEWVDVSQYMITYTEKQYNLWGPWANHVDVGFSFKYCDFGKPFVVMKK